MSVSKQQREALRKAAEPNLYWVSESPGEGYYRTGPLLTDEVAPVVLAVLDDLDDAEQRAERAEAAEQDAQADCDRRGERLWRLATEAGWRPGNDADNDATAETHIRERLRDAERAEGELAALRERVRHRAWAFDVPGKRAYAAGLRDLLDDDTTGAASGEGEK